MSLPSETRWRWRSHPGPDLRKPRPGQWREHNQGEHRGRVHLRGEFQWAYQVDEYQLFKTSLQIIRFNFISDILFYFVKNNQTWMWAGPGVRLLRGRGEWLPALPRLLPGPLPWRPGGDDQVELHLPQPDHIRSGKQGLNWKKKLICHHCTAFNLRICGPDC